ncbi:MAG TPA: pseudouridine synthase [Bacillota bacterium]
MRLDKLLANMGVGSRKEVKRLIKKKHVTVNGDVVKDPSVHVNPDEDCIKVDETIIHYQKYVYLMMNKPPGYISSTWDRWERTVIDLLEPKYKHFEPFPVGRLDKDTEGLLLLTNDGKLAHELLSPKKGVSKTYYAKVEGKVTEKDVEAFAKGVVLDDGYKTKPGKLDIISSDTISEIELTISEGKFHQVKRMFQAVQKQVIYLQRIRMGELLLDSTLPPGSYRELTEKEEKYCQSLR